MVKLGDVNTTDLVGAIELGCQTMGRVFNKDDDAIPFFAASVLPEPYLGFNPSHSESHVPGRHLNALLTAEDVLGIDIPSDVIERHWQAARYSFSGPVPFPLNRATIDGALTRFLPHNLREGFHALYALVAYRQSEEAMEIAAACIRAIQELWDPESGWDRERLAQTCHLDLVEWDGPFITGIARAIGPLVKLHRVTDYGPALELATLLTDIACADYFRADGAFDRDRFGTHTHSTTCVLSSLAQFADHTGDDSLLDRVQAFFDHGLNDISNAIGWSIENCGAQANPDRGECNNTGDIVETALILGRRRNPSSYQHAERILRSHLLPAQLRDVSFVPESQQAGDGGRDVASRLRGAFGFPAPYGHAPIDTVEIGFNLDIVGGTVGSLCEAVREGVTHETGRSAIHLLFDYQDDRIMIESPYTHNHLAITRAEPGDITIDLPDWVDRDAISVRGIDHHPAIAGHTLSLANVPAHQTVSIALPIPERETVIRQRTRELSARLRGDQVVAMSNHGADLTFFDDLG